MRSQFVSLKRDLKKQNLPMPKQLIGVENDRFVRKRIQDDKQHFKYEEDSMMIGSPARSLSPVGKQMIRNYSTAVVSKHMIDLGYQQRQPMAHKEQNMLYSDVSSEDQDYVFDGFGPAKPKSTRGKPTIDSNMDNFRW